MSWTTLRRKIKKNCTDSSTWKSDCKNLLEVFDVCQELGVISEHAERASISNLRQVVKEARIAVTNRDRYRLEVLFLQASHLTNIDLRLWLGSCKRDAVSVSSEDGKYRIDLSVEQFRRIQRSTRVRYAFSV